MHLYGRVQRAMDVFIPVCAAGSDNLCVLLCVITYLCSGDVGPVYSGTTGVGGWDTRRAVRDRAMEPDGTEPQLGRKLMSVLSEDTPAGDDPTSVDLQDNEQDAGYVW